MVGVLNVKRFAILRFDTRRRKTYLVAFVRADNAPHALGIAYKRFGVRPDLYTRSTVGKARYTLAPGFSGKDHKLRWSKP